MVFGLMKFYKGLPERLRVSFLVDLFFIGRFSPVRYIVFWLSVLLFTWFISLWLFLLFCLVVFSWFVFYYLLLIVFLYKWKKKHLNTKKY